MVAVPVHRVERSRMVERDNRLRGEESPHQLPRPSFILFLPSVESQLVRKTDTVPPYNIMTQSSHPRKHLIALGRHAATTLLAAAGIRTRKQEQYRKRRRMRKHNQRETTYVRRQEKGHASSINGKRQR